MRNAARPVSRTRKNLANSNYAISAWSTKFSAVIEYHGFSQREMQGNGSSQVDMSTSPVKPSRPFDDQAFMSTSALQDTLNAITASIDPDRRIA